MPNNQQPLAEYFSEAAKNSEAKRSANNHKGKLVFKYITIFLFFALQAEAAAQQIEPYFPGERPGKAIVAIRDGYISLSNSIMSCSWKLTDSVLKYHVFENHLDKSRLDLGETELFSIYPVDRSSSVTDASSFRAIGRPAVRTLKSDNSIPRFELSCPGKEVSLTLEHEDGFRVTWRAELRDGANYIRQTFSIEVDDEAIRPRGIEVFNLPAKDFSPAGSPDVAGIPFTSANCFFGLEHPMAKIVIKNGRLISQLLDDRVKLNKESVVLGVASPGQMRRCFLHYIERTRGCPSRSFLHYNSWYDITPILKPYDSKMFCDVIQNWGESFIKPYNVKMDAFALDDGWASCIPRKGIITLRNPKDEKQEIDIDLQKVFELPKGAQQTWKLKSPWKEDTDKPPVILTSGAAHQFVLNPFEVLVLETTE